MRVTITLRILITIVIGCTILAGAPERIMAQGPEPCIICPDSVQVTPDNVTAPSQWVNDGTFSQTFNVYYSGSNTATLNLTCSGGSRLSVTSCPSSVVLDPLEDVNVVVQYSTLSTAGVASLTLTAVKSGASLQDDGSINLTVIAPSLLITPPALTNVTDNATGTAVFQVRNNGPQDDDFTFDCVSNAALTCVGASPGSQNLITGAVPTQITAIFQSDTTTGSHTLEFRATHDVTGTTFTETAIINITRYDVSVAVVGGPTWPSQVAGTTDSVSFVVTNTGSATNTFSFQCPISSNVTLTSGGCPGATSLNEGAAQTITLHYSVNSTTAGSTSVGLSATGSGGASDSDHKQFVVHTYSTSVGVLGGTAVQRWANEQSSHSFTVKNTGSVQNTFILTTNCPSGADCKIDGATTVVDTLNPQQEDTVTVSYKAAAAPSMSVELQSAPTDGNPDTGTLSVNVRTPLATVGHNGPDTIVVATNATGTIAFTAQNGATQDDFYRFFCDESGAVSCSGGANPTDTTLVSGALPTPVTLGYAASAVPGNGFMIFRAQHDSSGAEFVDTVSVVVHRYAVTVKAVGDTIAPNRTVNQQATQAFLITNTGTDFTDFNVTCAPSIGVTVVGGCPASIGLAAGVDSTVTLTYNPGSTAAPDTSRYVTVSATGPNGAVDAARVWFAVHAFTTTVSPPTGATVARWANKSYTDNFTVQNTGSVSNPYTIRCISPSGCTVNGDTVVVDTLNASEQITAQVGYNVAPGSGNVVLEANPETGVTETGTLLVNVLTAAATLTHQGADTVHVAAGKIDSVTYYAKNDADSADFTFACAATGAVTCNGNPNPISAGLPTGQVTPTPVAVPYQANTQGGTGVLTFEATHQPSDSVFTHAVVVVVTEYAVSIAPIDSNPPPHNAGTNGSLDFLVTNEGSATATFAFTCNGSANLPVDSLVCPNDVTLGALNDTTVTVAYFTVDTLANDSSFVRLIAGDVPNSADTAIVYFAVNTFGAIVSGLGNSPTRLANTGPHPHQFAVQNTGSTLDTVTLTCSNPGGATNGVCEVNGLDTLLLPLDSAVVDTVSVDYYVAGSGGNLFLYARPSVGGTVDDFVVIPVSVPSVTIVAVGGVTHDTLLVGDSTVATFTVTNTGTVSDSFVMTCTGVTGCSVNPPVTSTLNQSHIEQVTVSYAAPGTAGADTLVVEAESVTGPPPATAQLVLEIDSIAVMVTPLGGAVIKAPGTTGHTQPFAVTNLSSADVEFDLTCSASGVVSCDSANVGRIGLAEGQVDTVQVGYGVAGEGTDTLKLKATSVNALAVVADSSFATITVSAATVAVTPLDSLTAAKWSDGSDSLNYVVTNFGTVVDTVDLECTATGQVRCQSVPQPIVLDTAESAVVWLHFGTGVPADSGNRLSLVAKSRTGIGAASGRYTIPVVAPAVAVTPDAKKVGALGGTTRTHTFTVRYGDTAFANYNITAVCTGAANASACTTPTPTLGGVAGQKDTVVVTYHMTNGTVGDSGAVRLIATKTTDATVADTGDVFVTVGTPQTPLVSLTEAGSGTTLDRRLCLTAAAGPAAVSECGDLRLTHALPPVRTMNAVRGATLIYNSQWIRPNSIVAANVSLPASAVTPDSVMGLLKVNGVLRDSAMWDGSAWSPGRAARVALAWRQAFIWDSGVFSYEMEVNAFVNNIGYPVTAIGELALLARLQSHYQWGWALAGVEQLLFVPGTGNRIMWTGGDGSRRIYTPVPGSSLQWVGPALDRPDTLVEDPARRRYVRTLANGGEILFDSVGLHTETVSRTGDTTRFHYMPGLLCGNANPASCNHDRWRVRDIWLPTVGGDSIEAYRFDYDSVGPGLPKLLRVVTRPGTPEALETTFARSLGQFVITDPDGQQTSFVEDTTNGSPTRYSIISRTDRRGTTTTFSFDSVNRLLESRTPLGVGQPDVVTAFRPHASLGVVAAVDTADAYALIDGPRTDVGDSVMFWLDSLGAPTRIRNALGFETRIERQDSLYPALSTRVTQPNGFETFAHYNARGNLDSTVAMLPEGPAVTRYEWDSIWNAPTKVTLPGGQFTETSYDPAKGNRLWQQDGRGDSTRVRFGYAFSSLVSHVVNAVGDSTHLVYNAHGNVDTTRSALGSWTAVQYDALGRVTVTESVTDTVGNVSTQWVFYDAMGRDTLNVTSAATDPDSVIVHTDTVVVRTWYEEGGRPDSVSRRSLPDRAGIGRIVTGWEYDAIGRTVVEIAADGARDSTFYDLGGNVVKQKTRRGNEITLEYDPLGRLTRRIVPEVVEARAPSPNPMFPDSFPMFSIESNGDLIIATDTAVFEYDAVGAMIRADNNDARIARRYDQAGRLTNDTLRIRTVTGTDFNQHAYGLEYGYDANGSRVWLKHPGSLAPAGRDSVHFGYDSLTGSLLTIGRGGETFVYEYDAAGRVSRLLRPGGITEEREYDGDSRLVWRRLLATQVGTYDGSFPAESVMVDAVAYDPAGRITSIVGWTNGSLADTTLMTYTGLGALATTQTTRLDAPVSGTFSEEAYTVDALGHTVAVDREGYQSLQSIAFTSSVFTSTYDSTGRLRSRIGQGSSRSEAIDYDVAGNRLTQDAAQPLGGGADYNEFTRYYYGADEKLRAVDKRSCNRIPSTTLCDPDNPVGFTDRTAFEEYRYDALGRRVFTRSRSEICNAYNCPNMITRTVWDGDQVSYEARYPGADSVSATELERDSGVIDLRIPEWICDPNQIPAGTNGCNDATECSTAVPGQEPAGCVFNLHPPQFYPFGVVGYIHGPGIDAPLAIERQYRWTDDAGVRTIVPLPNWKGDYAAGADLSGLSIDCSAPQPLFNCLDVEWPAIRWWQTYQFRSFEVDGPTNWLGGLVYKQQDASGLLYKRNRYYDPATGQFTQQDPIGLAGGLNLYGFAGGDPVNFSDPFGTCPEEKRKEDGTCPGGLTVEEWDAVVDAIRTVSDSLQGPLTDRLDEGRIRGGSFGGRTVARVRNVAPGSMQLNRRSNLGSAFELAAGDLGFVLVHEYDHQVVWGDMNVLGRFIGTWFIILNPKVGQALERRADLFACANSTLVSLSPPYIGSCPRR